MFDDEIIKAVEELGKVSVLLVKLKRWFNELEPPGISREFDDILSEIKKKPERALFVDSQFNKEQNCKTWTVKELKEMPFLKDLKYRRTKGGLHQFRYRRDGYNISFSSKNLTEAKKKAYKFIRTLKKERKKDIFAKVSENSFDFVAKAWFDAKKPHIDQGTFRSYLNAYTNHIQPNFGKRDIKEILPMHLQPYFDNLHLKAGRTCETVKIIFNSVFKFAIANRFATSNPMGGVIFERHYRTPGKALSDSELVELKSIAATLSNGYGIASLIILYTGIRGSELASLSFDWKNGTFTVNNAKLKKSQRIRPNKLIRTVPIFPALYPLKERIEAEEWKFEARTISGNWKRYFRLCSVKDLRHTFSTRARESGIDNEIVNIWMGHVPGTNLTANTYTHLSLTFQKKQALKMKPY